MITHQVRKTKLLAGPVSLGASHIDAATLTMDGEPLPSWVTLDATRGTVERTDGVTDNPTLYLFEFDRFQTAPVALALDKALVVADDADALTITVTVAGGPGITLPTGIRLARYTNGEKAATYDIPLTGGVGSETFTFQPGTEGQHEFIADPDALDAIWGRALAMVEVPRLVEVVAYGS